MKTRERIAEEALNLFSRKGYQGTSVKNIAEAVGIRDSSLYKHFRSKEEIFSTIVEEMSHRMEKMSLDLGLPDEKHMETAAKAYGELSVEGLLELSRKIFLFYWKDEFASRFRRMLTIEQYSDKGIYEVYRKIFMVDSITYQTALFQEMMRQRVFREGDPAAMAMNFYAPIYFLLNKYDQMPGAEEEAMEELERHVREFCRIYDCRKG
ncbi:TetR/AcrR family transcriptional regulator [Lactonifactor longoviformis]|uniref:Transcriptional regulator, TetR family n=1 Tax=Lactonifactor longoviformis DSM 17459 TaxID=1122155 RepID=A0A1M4U8X4_9CLOT|nr:TetR/AcrR family transcriptional regulator [Lactonifactor longoviformis]POP34829.1 TetR/AcrR family transcriptional regulator [Lactonifactor longoviformis]SHE53013.1 transcriptional regulator, TetR family [Lactonifactor longoviformis DSM 17459]